MNLKHYAHMSSNKPHSGSVAYTPMQLAKIYNFPTGFDGTGQKVGFIELGGGFRQADLNNYFSFYGFSHTRTVQFVSVDGASNHPTNANSADMEVMLDLCVAMGVAMNITPVVYMAPNTTQGFVDAIRRATSDHCNCISISWGAPENQWSGSDITAMNNALNAAAVAGISVFAASGDSGSSDGGIGNHVDFPGSSPFVTCCGGTSLSANISNFTILSETVWNNRTGATGGGISASIAMPTWQARAGIPGGIKRGVPDVAAVADPNTGIIVPVDGSMYIVGGTSAAAPFWAGLTAVMNQAKGKNLGFLNQQIYSTFLNYTGAFINSPLHDISKGNNGAYSAKFGWDACTGCGSPNAQKLIAALH